MRKQTMKNDKLKTSDNIINDNKKKNKTMMKKKKNKTKR